MSRTRQDAFNWFDSIIPDEDGCQLQTHAGIWFDGKTHRASRVVLERKLGRPIKPGYYACHTCDYENCVNPDHIYEGTPKENARDRRQRNPNSWNWMRDKTSEFHKKRLQWGFKKKDML